MDLALMLFILLRQFIDVSRLNLSAVTDLKSHQIGSASIAEPSMFLTQTSKRQSSRRGENFFKLFV